ncbi:MAG TPA: TldD/PmbA family protein, partial [Clostridia bacterium]|nr:TldD/PmbA family protein [Clostridia bacterium]
MAVVDYKEIASALVHKAENAGADQSEVFYTSGKELTIEVRNGEVDTLKDAREHGIGIRVLVGNRLGYAYTSDLSPHVLETALDQAMANAEKTTPDPFHGLPSPGQSYEQLEIYDEEIGRVPVEEKIDLARSLESAARGFDPRVKITESCTYQDAEYEVILVNSRGISQSYRGAYCGAFVYVVAEDAGDTQTGFGLQFRLKFKDLIPAQVGREAGWKAVRMLGAKSIKTQKAPVIFDPYVASGFLGVLAPALSAEAIQKGKSFFAGRLNSQVFSPLVTLIDDGAMENAVLSAPFDGEGMKTGKTTLIAQGTLQGYLHNTYTAAKDGVVSTGNAIRGSFKSTPEVGTTNFYIQKGTTEKEKLIQEIDRGLYITEVMGMHTANPISGDFSVGAAGIWIENGELTTPVRGVAIAGNLLAVFKNVNCVANDLTFFIGRG